MIQQIIRKNVARGYHVSTNLNFLDSMVSHYENLIQQVHEGAHIAFKSYVADVDDLKWHLLKSYQSTLDMYRANLINLIHSEN